MDHPDDTALSFDIETLPNCHSYPIMACAVSKDAWYAWVSPWLLGESEDPEHLIPFGNPDMHRVVVGHNVSYDRGRIAEEYSLKGTKSRFIDTMALHVAVKGISSHQRPAWKKHRKTKEEEEERLVEAIEVVENALQEGLDEKKEGLRKLRSDMEESLPLLQADEAGVEEVSSKRWEDLTSGNSLADVARLHCDIEMEKGIRNDFLTLSREEILDNLQDYLNYCGNDVHVTHAVFSRVLPAFLTACPSPVSFAGILTMGSSFLTVNESWEKYIENAEGAYKELEESVKGRLVQLANEAKELMVDDGWKGDVWLEQLDWTPKIAKESRGIVRERVCRLIVPISIYDSPYTSRILRSKRMNPRRNTRNGLKRYFQNHFNPAHSGPSSLSCLISHLTVCLWLTPRSMDGTHSSTDRSPHFHHPARRSVKSRTYSLPRMASST